ncbi:MAG: hypothetical protein QOD77_792 [Thermoplasmata archaeon]|jgi:hypothetical protein|nr:hypothetical protein [Thermoplasmata archaeon]
MLGRVAAAFAAGTLAWFLGEWIASLLWPDQGVNAFVLAWILSLLAAVLALILVGTRQNARRRAGGRW